MGGRWLNRHKNWLKEDKEIPSPVFDDAEQGVEYIPLRCPQCKSKDVRCYVSRLPVRYHYCRECGKKFKSVEA